MSNPNSFISTYITLTQEVVSNLEQLRLYNSMLTADPTLTTRYFSSTNGSARTDISSADIANAQAAIVQYLFTHDSGNPTQKSYLFKLLP